MKENSGERWTFKELALYYQHAAQLMQRSAENKEDHSSERIERCAKKEKRL